MQSVVFDNSLGKLDVSQRLKLTSMKRTGIINILLRDQSKTSFACILRRFYLLLQPDFFSPSALPTEATFNAPADWEKGMLEVRDVLDVPLENIGIATDLD